MLAKIQRSDTFEAQFEIKIVAQAVVYFCEEILRLINVHSAGWLINKHEVGLSGKFFARAELGT